MKNLILLTLCVTIFKNSEESFFNQIEEENFEKLESLILSQSSLIQDLQRTIASQEDQVAVLEKKLEHEEQRVPGQRNTSRTHTNVRRQCKFLWDTFVIITQVNLSNTQLEDIPRAARRFVHIFE